MWNLYEVFDFVLIDTRDGSLGAFRAPYLVFNSAEALCWAGVSLTLFWRWARGRRSPKDLPRALAFLAFSLSDVIELSGTTVGLLLFKGACLLAIINSSGGRRGGGEPVDSGPADGAA